VVARWIDEHLRLSFQAPERLRVENAVAVALKRRPQPALRLRIDPAAGLVGTDGERRQCLFFLFADRLFEAVRDLAGELWHLGPSVVACPAGLRAGFSS
jgi:hypothetical protein